MKTLKNITIVFQFLKNLIMKTNKTENNSVKLADFKGKLKFTKNNALSQMYAQDNETLFI